MVYTGAATIYFKITAYAALTNANTTVKTVYMNITKNGVRITSPNEEVSQYLISNATPNVYPMTIVTTAQLSPNDKIEVTLRNSAASAYNVQDVFVTIEEI